MIEFLARALANKRAFAVFLLLWAIVLASIVLGGTRRDWTASGQPTLRRAPLFVWLTLILGGYKARWVKRRWLGHYGLFEITFGLVGGYLALAELPLTQTSAWAGVAAAVFVVVRGADNVGKWREAKAAKLTADVAIKDAPTPSC